MIIHYRPDIVENLSMPPTKQVHSIYSEILINNFGDNDD